MDRGKDLTSLQPGWFLNGHSSSSLSENRRELRAAEHGPRTRNQTGTAGSRSLFAVPTAQPHHHPSLPAADGSQNDRPSHPLLRSSVLSV